MSSQYTPASARLVLGLCLSTALWMAPAQAAKRITCAQDDVRYEIDVNKLAIQYQATGLAATLSGLDVLNARVEVAPKTLQLAAVATQKLNEFVKALATGYNSCAISKKAYKEGIKSLLPAIQSDGKTLEALRQQLLTDPKVDAKRLEKVLADYNNKLERLARISGKGIDYERIGRIVDEQLAKYTQTILAGLKAIEDLNCEDSPVALSDEEANRLLKECKSIIYRAILIRGSTRASPAIAMCARETVQSGGAIPKHCEEIASSQERPPDSIGKDTLFQEARNGEQVVKTLLDELPKMYVSLGKRRGLSCLFSY